MRVGFRHSYVPMLHPRPTVLPRRWQFAAEGSHASGILPTDAWGDILEKSKTYLSKKKNQSYRLAAEILLGQFVQKDPLSLYLLLNQHLDAHQQQNLPHFFADLDKLAEGVVIQDIVGWQTFYGERLQVGKGVFVPRPESENLVDVAEEFLERSGPDNKRKPAEHVLELCVGSGAISVALAKKRPFVLIDAVDLSHEALDFAWKNVFTGRLESRIRLIQSDLYADPRIVREKYKVIVVNPPYKPLRHNDVQKSAVLKRAPEVSTFSGEDGLDLIRRIVDETPAYLQPDGVLLMEIDVTQAEAVVNLCRQQGEWKTVQVLDRTRGLSRILLASKQENLDLGFLKGESPSKFYSDLVGTQAGKKPEFENRNLRSITRQLAKNIESLKVLWTELSQKSEASRGGTQKEWIDSLIQRAEALLQDETNYDCAPKKLDPVAVFRVHLLTASLLEKHHRLQEENFNLFSLRRCDHLSGPILAFARFFILMDILEDKTREGNRKRQAMPKEWAPFINYSEYDALIADTQDLIEIARAFNLGRLNKYNERLSFTAKNHWQGLEQAFAKLLTRWDAWIGFFDDAIAKGKPAT